MHVKELTIQGFKSFATKHRFVFPAGITAIVGPNGSGKSNIADAIRWILGEQRASSLRARRTHEMIFAGTERRPRAGLAEVSLTFDNGGRWLDIDFSEVVITRRAHRDGASSFAINGAPVRMREVQDLLGSRLGQGNYTVIGQGLVDSALTLRPEDRRVLIDEAAGLVPLQRKRDHSLRQLAETDENLTRVSDIVAEIGPRLKRMARLASQAERYAEVSTELGEQLLTWYGYHWHRAHRQLDAARAATRAARAEAGEARAAVDSAEAVRGAAEAQSDEEEATLVRWRAEREALAASEAQARQAAVAAQARLDTLVARKGEVAQAGTGAAVELDRLRAAILGHAEELQVIEAELAAAVALDEAARADLAEAEAGRDLRARDLERIRGELFTLASDQATRGKRLESLEAGRAARQAELDAARLGIAALGEATAQLAELREAATTRLEGAQAALAQVAADVAQAETALARTAAALGGARDVYADARAQREALRARADALDALFGGSDQGGQILARLREAGDVRVIGTVAYLIEADEAWEAAVAAALGPQVHGVVVHDLADALRALHLVQSGPHGTVTLVALVCEGMAPLAWTARPGELTADELALAPGAPGLVRALCGDTVFVEDVDAARAALSLPRSDGLPVRAATRDGVLVERGGVLAGGTPGKAVLEIERERRALPAAVEAAAAAEAIAANEVDRGINLRIEIESRLADLADARAAAAAERNRAVAAEEQARVRVERAAREQAWAAENIQRLDLALAVIDQEVAAVRVEFEAGAPRETALREALLAAGQALEAADLAPLRAAAATRAAALADVARRQAGARAMLQTAEAELRAAQERLARDQARVQLLDAQGVDLAAEAENLMRLSEAQAAALATLDGRIGPAEARVREARLDTRHLAAARDAAARRLADIEARLGEARITETRGEDRLERLYDQLRSDAEWLPEALGSSSVLDRVDVETAADSAEADLVGADPVGSQMDRYRAMLDDAFVQALPEIELLPEGFEARLAALRRQIRTIGPIDRETLAAYQETADRFAVLNSEQADLQAAERDLRSLLATLEEEMAQRFDATYTAVAEAFAGFFPQLFGGGEAELVLLRDPESDGQAGLDILARPPGKRRQPLALLSGGERALTAVALVFSLLQVSQTPFVVLDEVDAALDEANVNRFCAALETLAAQRQVIIVTHNRGTIQTASTIYGVTMGDDGASQIISLEVDAALAAAH